MTVREPPRPALPPEASLDFVNTRFWRGKAQPTETLNNLEDLLTWARRHVGATPVAPEPGLFEAGIALRERLHCVFSARAEDRPVDAGDLAALNAGLQAAPARATLTDDFAWNTTPGTNPAGAAALLAPTLLAPVLWSAADLLAQGNRVRLRACANPECRYLFLDASRNGSRRWCDMGACGNRAKAQRHYLRSKVAKTQATEI